MSGAAGRWKSRAAGIVVVVVMCAARAGAQGTPARLVLDVPGSLGSATALHCPVGAEFQIGLRAYDSTGVETPLAPYQPEAGSSNDTVVVAAPAQHSAYVLEVRCKADGRADMTVHTGNVTLTIPVVVGKGRLHGAAAPRAASGGTAAPNGGAMPAADASAPVNEIAVTIRSRAPVSGAAPLSTTLYGVAFHRADDTPAGPATNARGRAAITVPWTDALPRLLRAAAAHEPLDITLEFYATNPDGTTGVSHAVAYGLARIDTLRAEFEQGGVSSRGIVTLVISRAAEDIAGGARVYTGSMQALRTSGLPISGAVLTALSPNAPARHAQVAKCSIVITPQTYGAARSELLVEEVLDGTAAAIARMKGSATQLTVDFGGTDASGQQVSAATAVLSPAALRRIETSFSGSAGVQRLSYAGQSLTLRVGSIVGSSAAVP